MDAVSLRDYFEDRLDHLASLRAADRELRAEDLRFQEERDRRYSEVTAEREKALKIKEVADLAALELAREIQAYKDEKANELREQINSERGLYVTKSDLTAAVEKMEAQIAPLLDWITTERGRSGARERSEDRIQPWQLWLAAGGLSFFVALVTFIANAATAS